MHLSAYIKQKSYERVEYLVRRDLITLVPAILGFAFLLLAPLATNFLIRHTLPTLLEGAIAPTLIALFIGIYYLSVGLFFYTYFVNFYLDLLIITNDRLLHINQIGLFARTISEVDLYQIQDITSEVHGFAASLFRYGDLIIQTAGALEKFMIYNIPNPEFLRRTILDLAEADRKFHQNPASPVK